MLKLELMYGDEQWLEPIHFDESVCKTIDFSHEFYCFSPKKYRFLLIRNENIEKKKKKLKIANENEGKANISFKIS